MRKPILGLHLNAFLFLWLEFIHLLASEANEVCDAEKRKTIGADHVFQALKVYFLLL